MDDLRGLDILPRSAREKVNHFKKKVENLRCELKREPTDKELCHSMDIDIKTCHRFRREEGLGKEISFETHIANGGNVMGNFLVRNIRMIDSNSPEALFHMEEVKKILAEEIERLSKRERQVIALYYYKEMTLKEIGGLFAITESRVSQIHAKAVRKLLRRLRKTFGPQLPIICNEVSR